MIETRTSSLHLISVASRRMEESRGWQWLFSMDFHAHNLLQFRCGLFYLCNIQRCGCLNGDGGDEDDADTHFQNPFIVRSKESFSFAPIMGHLQTGFLNGAMHVVDVYMHRGGADDDDHRANGVQHCNQRWWWR